MKRIALTVFLASNVAFSAVSLVSASQSDDSSEESSRLYIHRKTIRKVTTKIGPSPVPNKVRITRKRNTRTITTTFRVTEDDDRPRLIRNRQRLSNPQRPQNGDLPLLESSPEPYVSAQPAQIRQNAAQPASNSLNQQNQWEEILPDVLKMLRNHLEE